MQSARALHSGCNSTASCKNTRLLCGNKLLHLLGHGSVWPRRQPRRHLVLLSHWYLYLCRRTGCRHWCIDATLRTHFVVIDDIHCRLSTHLSLRSQGIVPQQYLLHCFTPPLCPMLHATCRSLKYYNKFASRVRLLVPHTTLRGSYLNLPASSCFILRPSPLYSVFAIKQLLLARWLHVRCFLSLPLTLPTQCVLLPWNVAESSETSCRILQGLTEACRLSFCCRRLVGSQPHMLEMSCRVSP